jgi:hypothetical protein
LQVTLRQGLRELKSLNQSQPGNEARAADQQFDSLALSTLERDTDRKQRQVPGKERTIDKERKERHRNLVCKDAGRTY